MAQSSDEDFNPFAAPESDLAPEQFEPPADHPNYAGLISRIVAIFIDFVINYLVIVPCMMIGLHVFRDDVGRVSPLILGLQFAVVVFVWLYFALQESSTVMGTVGKRVMGLRVVTLSGERISFLRATARTLSKIISYAACSVGFLMQPFTSRRQALHDILAGTIVVKGK